MQSHFYPQSNYTFTARCPQVRDADWVCRVINHAMPNSSTKHQPRIMRYLKANENILPCQDKLNTMADIYNFLDDIQFTEKHSAIIDTLMAIKRTIKRFGDKRLNAQNAVGYGTFSDNLYNALYMMTQYKSGNCTENAIVAELIMKMNGFPHAKCAILNKSNKKLGLQFEDSLDHLVCIFNKDKSCFNGKITPQTIIIDPWLGKADFAQNMERYYRNECSDFFELTSDEVFKYQPIETVEISEIVMRNLTDSLPEFIFKNKNRKFMQNISKK